MTLATTIILTTSVLLELLPLSPSPLSSFSTSYVESPVCEPVSEKLNPPDPVPPPASAGRDDPS